MHERIDGHDHVIVLELDAPGDRSLVEDIAARQADARLVILVERADHGLRATLMDAGADHVLDGGATGAEILASVGTHVRRLNGATRGAARSNGPRATVRGHGGPLPPRESGDGSVQVGTAPERVEVEEGLVVDLGRMQIERGDRCLDLTPLEAGILGHVMHNSDRVVARDEILEVVWGGRESRACARTVDVHVVALRRKLHGGTSGSQRLLRTVRGLGYRWCG
ncbi:winged helix-turn-helix transcriptional regulator [Rohdeia mirabilis]|uniref:winged helix-turn-helix transcriptional regulator n=1 Tax=Rohdeia mirabilis TaxID=2528008 RepID=UPI003AF3E0EB